MSDKVVFQYLVAEVMNVAHNWKFLTRNSIQKILPAYLT